MKKLLVILLLTFAPLVAATHAQNNYMLRQVAGGFSQPLLVTHAGDDRLFVVEQTGRIRIIQNGSILSTPFLNVSSLITTSGSEQGLLGLAFHPNYAQNGWFFINYTNTAGDTVVARYTVSSNPNVANANSAVTVLTVDQPFVNHNGGHLAFGPDGYLYIAVGDGGSGGDPQNRAQNLQTLLGKILRINVNQLPYTSPASNPFAGGGGRPEIWAYGLRNPWRFAFDRQTSDLYIADVGQNAWEEVNFQPASSPGGENYGWKVYEGNESFTGGSLSGVTFPVAVYPHDNGNCSVTGGHVYRGTLAPGLEGVYLYGDYCSGIIWTMQRNASGQWNSTQFMDTSYRISSFGEDVRGDIYVVHHGGQIFRLEAANLPPTSTPTSLPTVTLPPTLTPTNTPLPTATPTLPPTNTPIPSATPTLLPTAIPTLPPTNTPEPTLTETPLPTNTLEPTLTETPLPTNTLEPTATELPPPTIPAGPALRVDVIPSAGGPGDTVSVALNLLDVTGVYGLQVRCVVNPAVLAGVAYADADGFNAGNSFFVDHSFQPDGSWLVAASLLHPAPAISGSVTAFSLLYNVQSADSTLVTCSALAVDEDGRELPLSVVSGSFNGAPTEPTATIEPTAEPTLEPTAETTPTETPTAEPTLPAGNSTISGVAAYQNRADDAGITIQVLGLDGLPVADTVTGADGAYSLTALPLGAYTLRLSAPQHITLERTVLVESDGQVIDLGSISLPAGDTDDNSVVDTADATLVGANFDVSSPPAPANADLNGDGLVNITDLVLVGSNFGLASPVILD